MKLNDVASIEIDSGQVAVFDAIGAIDVIVTEQPVVDITVTTDGAVGPIVTELVTGQQGPGNLHIGPTNELGAGVGLWIETIGEDFSMWFEDGT